MIDISDCKKFTLSEGMMCASYWFIVTEVINFLMGYEEELPVSHFFFCHITHLAMQSVFLCEGAPCWSQCVTAEALCSR